MRGPAAFPWPAVWLLLGAATGSLLEPAPPSRTLAAIAASLALPGRRGRGLALALTGALAVWLAPAPLAPYFPSPDRPVRAVAQAEGPPRAGPFGWSLPVRIERLRQGRRVERVAITAFVSLPELPPPAHRFQLAGYLDRSVGVVNQAPAEAGPWRLRVKSLRFVEPLASGWRGWWRSVSWTATVAVEKGLGQFGPKGGALARALLLGDPDALPPRVRRGLRRFGIAHLTAVSGLHVTLLVGAGAAAGRLLPRPLRLVPPAVAGMGYLALIGPRPALLRASAMTLLAAAALRSGRPPQSLHALGTVGVALCLGGSGGIRDLGLQLTLAATAGILLSPLLSAHWPGGRTALGRALAASLGAQIATWPFALPAFHLLAPAAPLLNLVAVPWAAGVLVLAAGGGVLSLLVPGLAALVSPLLEVSAAPFWWLAALPARWAGLQPVGFGAVEATAASALVAAGVRYPRWGALQAAAVLLVACARPPAPADPEVRMLDVGQGEAILVADRGRAVLIDGGGWVRGDIAAEILLPALGRAGIRRLDAVVLTHPDADHCTGLAGLVDYLAVAELWTPPGWPATGCALDLLTAAGPRLRPLWSGMRRSVGRFSVAVLHPAPGARRPGNNRSLVLRVEAEAVRFLLTGDVERAAEREILGREGAAALRAAVLKLAHHGSATSTSADLLAAVSPRLAIASAGAGNRYGHPSERVKARLVRAGVPLLSTDRYGQIRMRVLEGRLALVGGRRQPRE